MIKTVVWLKLEKSDKNSQDCAINSYRRTISLVQESNFCPFLDTHSCFNGSWKFFNLFLAYGPKFQNITLL